MPLDFKLHPRVVSLPGPSCSLAECEATRGVLSPLIASLAVFGLVRQEKVGYPDLMMTTRVLMVQSRVWALSCLSGPVGAGGTQDPLRIRRSPPLDGRINHEKHKLFYLF
jgi:hypothetical protein